MKRNRNLASGTLNLILLLGSLCAGVCAESLNPTSAREQYLLAREYENGIRGAENPKQAAALYRQAAEQGYAPAQYSLGRLYAAGSGVGQDYAEAARWFQKAAAQNYALAQNRLGVMHEKGQGVPKDQLEAYKWYFLASRQNENVFAVANCELLSRHLTADQIAEGQRRASATPEFAAADPKK